LLYHSWKKRCKWKF